MPSLLTQTMSPGRILGFVQPGVPPSPKSAPLISIEETKPPRSGTAQTTTMKKHGLANLAHLGRDRSKDKARNISKDRGDRKSITSSPQLNPVKHVNKLDITWESPPNIFYGTPQQSTGALFSGQLRVTVADPEITLDTFTMELVASVTTRKPVSVGCLDCTTQNTNLNKWTFLKSRKTLSRGEHTFPFSYLLPGHLPASTQGQLGALEYSLQAKAMPVSSGVEAKPIYLRYPIPIYRAIIPPVDKNSLRIFPPTNLTAQLTLQPVIHPIGNNNVVMRISGIAEKQKDIQVRWRLRKMSWRLEEMEKMISPACTKHAGKVGGEGKGIQYEDARTIGFEEKKDGWKTDFSDGQIEMEFAYYPFGSPRPLCDMQSPTGLSISHVLIVELVVAEEWATMKKLDSATPTGAARVLRMQFPVVVTERSGMGISWDEEQPPMYEDVPASPPLYPAGERPRASGLLPAGAESQAVRTLDAGRQAECFDYTGPPLDEPPPLEEIERLSLGEPRAGPSSARTGARARLTMEDFEAEYRGRRAREDASGEQTPETEDRGVGQVS